MKAQTILLLCSVAALPRLAIADETSPQILGIAQAVADFCSHVDSKDAATFHSLWKKIGGKDGKPDRQAYDQTIAYLDKFSKPDAVAGCAALLGESLASNTPTHGKRPDDRSKDDHGHK